MTTTVEYNGTTGTADAGYSSDIDDLNIFYDVRSLQKPSLLIHLF